jgi:hydrogenase expression/formation protein HypD
MQTSETVLAQRLIEDIHRTSNRPVRLMEFCGGHTVAILKHGLRQLLPKNTGLFSGPGCPVCVTAVRDIDRLVRLSQEPGIIIASFGDLLRVPGSGGSLQNREQKAVILELFTRHWKPWISPGNTGPQGSYGGNWL